MATRVTKVVLILLALPLVAIAGVFVWYAVLVTAYQHKLGWLEVVVHYRIAFGVEVDGSTDNGSTVVQVTYQEIPHWQDLFGPGIAAIYKGQAGCVKLSSGKVVCILPGARSLNVYSKMNRNVGALADRLLSVLGSPVGPKSKWTPIQASSAASVSGTADIPLDLLPAIIVLDDPLNPASAHLFDPEHPERSLGPGSRFLDATIAVTSDPVSDHIERTLPWLADQKIPQMLSRREDPFWVETGQPLYKSFFY
jgi:hypothetical protein